MLSHYNRIAGRSVERLAALSDGIFGVAMTLLVLDLRVPATAAAHGEHDLWLALVDLSPRLLMYMMSFMTLGIFWIGQQTQLQFLARSDRGFSWMQLLFLFAVTLTPFSTILLAEHTASRLALVVYWLNILVLGAALYVSWICAEHTRLLKDDVPPEAPRAIRRRILIAQALYAGGAALCVLSTTWSIAFIVVVQLYYAVAPRLPARWRSQPPDVGS
jgi:uncharacterized membrane protein